VLRDSGFVRINGPFRTADEAFARASSTIDSRYGGEVDRLSIIADYVLPPADGPATRDFQTLHFDFGLPLDPRVDQDVARYIALYVPDDKLSVSARTRLVPLRALLAQRAWSTRPELIKRLIEYGRTHGAWDDAQGYVEGSLARIVEAAAGSPPELPSARTDPDFLCGLEFQNLRAELAFFARHGLRVEDVAVDVALQPGQLLIFNNLALAHGRRGTRAPGELRQRVFGHKHLKPSAQRQLRDSVLSTFSASTADSDGAVAATPIAASATEDLVEAE
jgi:hypothetical protein